MNFNYIIDFETLSTDTTNSVALDLSILKFEEKRFFSSPYDFNELVNNSKTIKFDVKEQVKVFGRKISQDTLNWWMTQDKKVRKLIEPSDKDVSIKELPNFLFEENEFDKANFIFCRGTNFDAVLYESLMKSIGKPNPIPYWKWRDTRSLFQGLTYTSDYININKFIPEEVKPFFKPHSSADDIALDVYRFQFFVRIIFPEYEINV